MEKWNLIVNITQVVTGITAIFAIIFSVMQMHKEKNVSKTDFLLTLRDAFVSGNRDIIGTQKFLTQ